MDIAHVALPAMCLEHVTLFDDLSAFFQSIGAAARCPAYAEACLDDPRWVWRRATAPRPR